MSDNNYYVAHHEIANVHTTGQKTKDDKFDDGYSRNDAEDYVVELIREAISGSAFAEIVVSVSGKQGRVIRFGQGDNDIVSAVDLE